MKYCDQCGTQMNDRDRFCPECGTRCDIAEESGPKAADGLAKSEGQYVHILILALASLIAIAVFPIINCASSWIDVLSGGATTITLWSALNNCLEYGTSAFDGLDVLIGLTVLISSIFLLCGALSESKAVCKWTSILAALFMLIDLLLFKSAVSNLYFLGDYFSLSLGFWVPLLAHGICLLYIIVRFDKKIQIHFS